MAGDPAVPVLAWESEPVALSAEEALGVSAGRPSRCETTAKWLEGLLSRGPLATTDVEQMAKAAGFSARTLRRARQALGVVCDHSAPTVPWVLRLAESAPRAEAAS